MAASPEGRIHLHLGSSEHFSELRGQRHILDSNPGPADLIPFGGCMDVCACNFKFPLIIIVPVA